MSPIDRERRPKGLKEAGITLAEMLVVLLLIGMITVLTAPVARFSGEGIPLDRAASQIRDALRVARDAALTTGRSSWVAFDTEARSVAGADGTRIDLSDEISMSVTGEASAQIDGDRLRITFQPDGSSSGGLVLLNDGIASAEVRADWLTGAIDVTR